MINPIWTPSPNFWPGRKGHSMATPPSYIVLHTMVGTLEAAVARFLNPASQVSAHYLVAMDGRVVQMVQEHDAAWHAGTEAMNLDSIGIEHEDQGRYNDPRPDALYQASSALVTQIVSRYPQALVADSAHVIPHRQVVATACPDALDVNRIITKAGAPAQEANMLRLLHGDGEDHHGKGPVYLSDGLSKRWVVSFEHRDWLVKTFGLPAQVDVEQAQLDLIPEGTAAPGAASFKGKVNLTGDVTAV